MKTEYSNNISLIDSLTESLKNDSIGCDERAQMHAMKRSLIENYIKNHHTNTISTYTSRGYTTYTTRVKGGNKISAQSIEKLYEKLYEFYSGKTFKNNATFASVFKEALEWHSGEKNNCKGTITRNEKLYNAKLKGSDFEKIPLKDVRPHDIKVFLNSFSNNIRSNELGNIKTLINFTFQYACEELEIIPYNVAAGISIKSVKCLPDRNVGQFAYTQIEAKKIVSYLISSKDVYHEAICFAFYVGLRFSELSDLKWTDIEDRLLTITHANTESGNLKNGEDSVKTIYLCDEALKLLERYKAEHPDSEWVFPNAAGNKIFNNRINEKLHEVCNKLGIRYRPSHKIRAYAITQVSASGDFESARKFAGHTDYRMTLRYINGQITDANRKATEALNLGIQTDSDHFSAKDKTS
ncbi:MAG: tyrosine-type recombinase/integrase [Lachnospiraceae bacterium]|nr:tyrosine-type recombinase/integrase [Lachnospiraceae bacterium]